MATPYENMLTLRAQKEAIGRRRLMRRWERFGVDRDRHHIHDFSPFVIEGDVHEICACGQSRRRL